VDTTTTPSESSIPTAFVISEVVSARSIFNSSFPARSLRLIDTQGKQFSGHCAETRGHAEHMVVESCCGGQDLAAPKVPQLRIDPVAGGGRAEASGQPSLLDHGGFR
jgi:hypothetical protein